MDKVAKIVVGTVSVVAIAGVGYGMYVGVVAINDWKEKEQNIQQITDQEKEEERKLLEEISKDTPDKNPESIVIPDDITEEEKQELEQEKTYWSIVSEAKGQISEYIHSYLDQRAADDELYMVSEELRGFDSVRRINNFYISEIGSLVVECDCLYYRTMLNGEKILKQSHCNLEFASLAELKTDTPQDVLSYIAQSKPSVSISNISDGLNVEAGDDFYDTHIKTKPGIKSKIALGCDVELISISGSSKIGNYPRQVETISKITDIKGHVSYVYISVDVGEQADAMTKEQWLSYCKGESANYKPALLREDKTLYEVGFDWQELAEKYSGITRAQTQEAEAASVVESKYSTGNGRNFDAYLEDKKESEAKNLAGTENSVTEVKVAGIEL